MSMTIGSALIRRADEAAGIDLGFGLDKFPPYWPLGQQTSGLIQVHDLLAPVDFDTSAVYLQRLGAIAEAMLANRDDIRGFPEDPFRGRVMPGRPGSAAGVPAWPPTAPIAATKRTNLASWSPDVVFVPALGPPNRAVTRNSVKRQRCPDQLSQFQGSGPQPPSRESGGQATVRDMSPTRNLFHCMRFRGAAPGKGHYLLVPLTGRPPAGSGDGSSRYGTTRRLTSESHPAPIGLGAVTAPGRTRTVPGVRFPIGRAGELTAGRREPTMVLSAISSSGGAAKYGVHLPLADLGSTPSLASLKTYARAADEFGYSYLCVNDHLLYSRPWLDGPTTLAAVIDESGSMRLATTVSLPVLRGPVPLAKTLAALDVLSNGRLLVAVGPGSSAQDYAAVGVPFAERWRRFDEAVLALRALLRGDRNGVDGEFYRTRGVLLEPSPARPGGPPVWIASWGSTAGLRRVAAAGDGWLASAYNTTPERFRVCLAALSTLSRHAGAGSDEFPNALATTWLYVTEDSRRAERMITDVLAPMLNRPADLIRELDLPIGPAQVCAERLTRYAVAGVQRIFLWPLGDEVRQLELFQERVAPLVSAVR